MGGGRLGEVGAYAGSVRAKSFVSALAQPLGPGDAANGAEGVGVLEVHHTISIRGVRSCGWLRDKEGYLRKYAMERRSLKCRKEIHNVYAVYWKNTRNRSNSEYFYI